MMIVKWFDHFMNLLNLFSSYIQRPNLLTSTWATRLGILRPGLSGN
jgi:hypothetical protein